MLASAPNRKQKRHARKPPAGGDASDPKVKPTQMLTKEAHRNSAMVLELSIGQSNGPAKKRTIVTVRYPAPRHKGKKRNTRKRLAIKLFCPLGGCCDFKKLANNMSNFEVAVEAVWSIALHQAISVFIVD